jgi:hypothetical protein
MGRLPPLLEELAAAALLMTTIAVLVALLFWRATGVSPWPFVVLTEIAGFGWGTVMLALSSPRRR